MLVMLSIHKEYADMIFKGIKTIELRKNIPTQITFPATFVLYETKKKGGAGKVVGQFTCNKIDKTNVFSCMGRLKNGEEVERKRQKYALMSGLTVPRIYDYAYNAENLYLYYVTNPIRYNEPVELEKYGFHTPPLSWRYISEGTDEI